MTVDLVLPTVARTDELGRFLDALAGQSFREFRLLVGDQNPDGRAASLLERYRGSFPIVHVRVEGRGVSRARNAVLPLAAGDLVGLSEDDSWYPPSFLERLVETFAAHPGWDCIAGRTLDERGAPSGLRWQRQPGPINRGNIFRTAIGPAIFLRRRLVEAVGSFDETLGVGAGTAWASSEETDYLLRALEQGFELAYVPALGVFHPGPSPRLHDRAARDKAYSYGVGHSELLRRHGYPASYAAWRALQLFLGAPAFLLRGRPGSTRYYWAMARGRARGLIAPQDE